MINPAQGTFLIDVEGVFTFQTTLYINLDKIDLTKKTFENKHKKKKPYQKRGI
jgi:hypothetical protein